MAATETPSAERTLRRDAAANRDRILEAARAAFDERGLDVGEAAGAGGERDISLWPATPPAPDLRFVVGGVLESAFGSWVLPRRITRRLAAAAGASDD